MTALIISVLWSALCLIVVAKSLAQQKESTSNCDEADVNPEAYASLTNLKINTPEKLPITNEDPASFITKDLHHLVSSETAGESNNEKYILGLILQNNGSSGKKPSMKPNAGAPSSYVNKSPWKQVTQHNE